MFIFSVNIIFASYLDLPSSLCLSDFPITCPAFTVLDLMTAVVFDAEYKSWCFSLYSFLQLHVTSSLLGADIFYSSLFLKTLCLSSSCIVKGQVSHPFKTVGKAIVRCILIVAFLDSKGTKDAELDSNKNFSTSRPIFL
jgi:hypothetical protein